MFSIPRLKYFTVSIIICLISVKAASLLTYHVLKPAETNDLQAYQLICQGNQSQELADLQIYSTQAAQIATDKELKKLADFISRISTAVLNNGVTKKAETTSLTGFIKVATSMGINPSAFLEGAALTIEGLLVDYEKIGQQVDARYQPLLRKQQEASKWSMMVFLYGLAFGLFVVWDRRPKASTATSQSSPSPSDNQPTKESPIIVCPACGGRNRSQPLSTGQKLVCGQCKAVLLSVS